MKESTMEIFKEIVDLYEENKQLKNDLKITKKACEEWYESYNKLLTKYKEVSNGL